MKIPHTIHCCWLGGGEKTPLARKCRAGWETILTHRNGDAEGGQWQIREWTAYDIENCGLKIPPFVREAMARQKWAFAADWLRFAALYLEGGVYFDYDFELLKPIDDLVAQGAFVAGEWLPDGTVVMGGAILALEKGSPIAKAMLDHYETAAFDGQTTVGEILASRLSSLASPVLRVLPPEVFSPIDVNGVCHQTAETRGIHHYAMSWAGPKRRFAKWLAWHGMRKIVEHFLLVRKWFHAQGGIMTPAEENCDTSRWGIMTPVEGIYDTSNKNKGDKQQ